MKRARVASLIAIVRRRLTEPSTYAGLAILGELLGVKGLAALSTPEAAAALAALAAILIPG